MKVIVIVTHPNKKSFNHAITLKTIAALKSNGHDIIFHDLYKEKFDPVVPAGEIVKNGQIDGKIIGYCDELKDCGGIVFIHPNWWGQPPAILKGWIDRVIRPGVAYRFNEGDGGEGVPEGLLSHLKALVINTTDTEHEREKAVFGDPLDDIWKRCIFEFCGIKKYIRKTFGIIVTSTPEQRELWLDETGKITADFFHS